MIRSFSQSISRLLLPWIYGALVEMHVVRYWQLFAKNEKRQHDTTVAFQTTHKTTPYNVRKKIGKMRNPDHHPLSLYVTYQVFWQYTCVYVNIYSTKEKRTWYTHKNWLAAKTESAQWTQAPAKNIWGRHFSDQRNFKTEKDNWFHIILQILFVSSQIQAVQACVTDKTKPLVQS